MASLDTELDSLLAEKDYFEKNRSAGKLPIGPDEPLRIAVKFMAKPSRGIRRRARLFGSIAG